MLHRLIAVSLLVLTSASNVEAVIGSLRDGEVHHEDLASALSHASAGGDEHGHEDASEPSRHRHNDDHEHGTSSDHCTHQHGIAVLPSFAFVILAPEGDIAYADPLLRHPLISETLVHPPRA